jgi:Cu(I)/Ag(I) efflux system membrane fusion protein
MRFLPLSSSLAFAALLSVAQADDAPRRPLFYLDPDGKPFYASGPKKTSDGRDYRPIFSDPDSKAGRQAPAAPLAPAAQPEDRRILYYRNPMGLPDTSPKPKNDSMGMAYIPAYADEAGRDDPPGTVRITPGRLQTLGVRTEAAEMRPPAGRTIRATGTLQFDERRLAAVTTRVPGWIEHLTVAANGDPVRRGETVAEIYSPEMVVSEEEYLIAAHMGGAVGAASLQRLRALDIPDDEIARLQRSRRSVRRIPILAQVDGVVIDKPVQEGMRVDAGTALYRTADLSSLWLIAQVQEQDLRAIVPGQAAHVTFVAFPGQRFEGRVEFISPSLSADTRTARVRIVLPNPDGMLRAAMYANVQIETAAGGEPVLTVPNAAVLDTGTRQVVLVTAGDGRFEPRVIHLGIHGDDWVQVTAGIKPGERVVVGANFLIDSESNLRAALQGFADSSKPPSTQMGATP